MVNEGCEYAIMEASSHALDQKRIYGLNFEIAAFTNLTQDHLDYHETMEKYFEAKSKLFGTRAWKNWNPSWLKPLPYLKSHKTMSL